MLSRQGDLARPARATVIYWAAGGLAIEANRLGLKTLSLGLINAFER